VAKIVKARKPKVRRNPPPQPAQQKLNKMSIKEIADLIIQTRDSLWPSAKGAETIAGLDGKGEED